MAASGGLGDDERDAARAGARGGGPGTDALGGDHRLAERQGDGKREIRGYDVNKKVNGCTRHTGVDTLGLLLTVMVHAADIADRDEGLTVLAPLVGLLLATLRSFAVPVAG